jgi:rubrerythrin
MDNKEQERLNEIYKKMIQEKSKKITCNDCGEVYKGNEDSNCPNCGC